MRTSISDYEMDRAWTVGPEAEGADAEAAAKAKRPGVEEKPVTKSKLVEADDKPAPKKTTARSKAK
jgi:hypothetical protein